MAPSTSTRWLRHIRRALLLTCIALAARSAQASLQITYSITIDQPVNVTNIAFWEGSDEMQSLAWYYSANGLTTTEIKSLYFNPPYPDSSFILGLVADLPDDLEPGLTHLVLMMSEVAAGYTLGLEWNALFPATQEADVISAIQNLNSPDFDESVAASVFLFSFIENELGAGFTIPDTTETVPYHFKPGDAFTVVAFSQGQQIGSGVSSVSSLSAAVPEPASAALLAAGFVTFIGLSRRGRAGMRRGCRPAEVSSVGKH